MSDLASLFDMSKMLDQRLRYLQAAKNGGTSIRRSLGGDTSTSSSGDYNLLNDGYGKFVLRSTEKTTVTDKYWMTARMVVTSELPDAQELPEFVIRNALGLNVSASTLWNMVPWSWLSDYFVNIGDFLEAQRGFIRWQVPKMCIMHRSEAVSKLENKSSDLGCTWVGGDHMTTVTKRRAAYVNPTPTFAFRPFLTNGMMANLGALITAKALQK